jgi:hypothetical protein
VRETADLVEIFKDHADKGDIFLLDDLLGYFMMDIIGAVTLGFWLRLQKQFNQLAYAMRSQVRSQIADGELNIFKRWNLVRPLLQLYSSQQMESYISKELAKRFVERQISNAPLPFNHGPCARKSHDGKSVSENVEPDRSIIQEMGDGSDTCVSLFRT